MPVPVIDPTQSILSVRQGEYTTFQPFASNTPTAWAATRLPIGFACDAINGVLYGNCGNPGLYVFGVRAYNASGWSAEQRFTIAIENNGILSLVPAIELSHEISTGEVSISSAVATTAAATGPLLTLKSGDARLVHYRITKNGTALDLPLSSLRLGAKEFDDEGLILDLSGATFWQKKLSGTSTYYELLIDLGDPRILAALFDSEDPAGTFFDGQGEFEVVWPITFGSTTVNSRVTSNTFDLRLVRELIKNA